MGITTVDRDFGKHIRHYELQGGTWIVEFSVMAGWQEVVQWCRENGGDPHGVFWQDNTRKCSVLFDEQIDLMTFLLRWS